MTYRKIVRNCVICGEELEGSKLKKYCSPGCSREAKWRAANPGERTRCPACGAYMIEKRMAYHLRDSHPYYERNRDQ